MLKAGAAVGLAMALFGAGATAAVASIAADEAEYCAGLGFKQPGSAAGARQAARIEQRFRAAGLDTSVETFHMPSWEPRSASLRTPRAIRAESFAYSGTGTVTAPVVDVGGGRDVDYANVDVKGKIALVSADVQHRTRQLDAVVDHGGIGMIFDSGRDDDEIATGSVRWGYKQPAAIPTVTITGPDGDALRSDVKSGEVTATVTVDAERVDVLGRNVIGVRRGTTHPDRYIVVGGHYDSWHAGAVDNCSAVGSLLQLVDDTKDLRPAYTVIYAGWDAEETGLIGSYSWLTRHPDILERTVLNENLEMTSAKGPLEVPFNPATLAGTTSSPALIALLTQGAATNAYTPLVVPVDAYRAAVGGIVATDMEGFYAAGVQAFTTFTNTPHYHTTKDTFETVDVGILDRTTAYLVDVLEQVQALPPEALTMREVPTVTVSAPRAVPPGAAVTAEIRLADPAGRPMSGETVRVIANQRDNWAVSEGVAAEVGGGVYRYTVPAGATDAGRLLLRASVSTPKAIGAGYATLTASAPAGGLLAPGTVCRSRRVLTLRVRGRVRRVRATTTHGRVRVVGGNRVRVDLRDVERGTVTVRVSARTVRGRLLRQTRTYRTCARLTRTE